MASKYIQRDSYGIVHFYAGFLDGPNGPEHKAVCGEGGFPSFNAWLLAPKFGVCQDCLRVKQLVGRL